MDKPKCKLIGTDGNVFSVIGKVSKTLKDAGQKERADEFKQKAFECDCYPQVLGLVKQYVEVY